eukprot:967505-Rhodomonas_salina.1
MADSSWLRSQNSCPNLWSHTRMVYKHPAKAGVAGGAGNSVLVNTGSNKALARVVASAAAAKSR